MKRIYRSELMVCLLALLACPAAESFGQAKKALFVIVDGISAEQLKKVKIPNLDAIAKEGGFTNAYVGGEIGAYSQTPTISAVGYNSLLTGTWVNKHNVWDNSIDAPNYNYWTIFRFFRQAYPSKQTAVFSTWQDNRTKLVGESLPETGHLRLGYSFEGFELDTIRFRHDKESDYIHQIDELVVHEASKYITEKAPDLSWVYLEYTDDMGHKYGNSEQFSKAIAYMDDQMGRLWKAIKYRESKFGEDWQIFITTDHGREEPAGKNHGGQSEGERNTWIVTNAKDLNKHFGKKQEGDYKPGIVDIMPTIARHLDISIPKEQSFELDGVPLTGKISVGNPQLKKESGKLNVSWTTFEKDGTVKIWLATSNKFKTNGQDYYYLVGEVPVTDQSMSLDISRFKSGYYKVVIEGKYNAVNKWVIE